MSIETLINCYKTLHGGTLWRLLCADTAPEILAYLQTLLFDNERVLKASVATSRLEQLLNRTSSVTITREEAQGKLSDWRKRGFLVTHFAPGDEEPTYELSVAAYDAIRFVDNQTVERAAPTGSRLELVMHAIMKLADDTNDNLEARITRLKLEKRRIDERIHALKNGLVDEISEMELRAEIEDIVQMLDALDGDFLRVRDRFRVLADAMHERITQNQSTSDEVLASFFEGYDAISDSDEGKTFRAFYRFLNNSLALSEIDSATQALSQRPFWNDVTERNQSKIANMRQSVNSRARETQAIMKRLSGSLKHLVQSREYVKNRRLSKLLEEVQRLSLELTQSHLISVRDEVLQFQESTISTSSVASLALHDPSSDAVAEKLEAAPIQAVDLVEIAKRFNASEINYALLKKHICQSLIHREIVTIADVLLQFPAEQGLGTIIGYLHLALEADADFDFQKTEQVQWKNRFKIATQAMIPIIFFSQDSLPRLGLDEETIKHYQTELIETRS